MKIKILSVTLAIILALTLVSPLLAAPSHAAITEAANWLVGQQNADGGFSNGFSPESNLSATADAVIALAAAGRDAGALKSSDGASPLDYLYHQVRAGGVDGVGTKAKVVLALVATGLDPANFAGQNLVGQLEAAYDPDTGSYGGSLFDQALVILALVNAGRAVPEGAADYLMTYQTTDGAWNFAGDTAALSGDTNTTALAIQALVAAGRKDEAGRGLAYLRRVQNEDAGWPYQNPSPYGTETDANSTAFVIQALYAAGQTPADWYAGGADPMGALLSLQNANGSFSYQASFPGDNALATIQAIPAIAGVTLVHVKRTPTSEAPGSTAGAPILLPESGEAIYPVALGFVALGLLLAAVGLWIKHRQTQVLGIKVETE